MRYNPFTEINRRLFHRGSLLIGIRSLRSFLKKRGIRTMKRFWFSFLAALLLVSALAIAAGVQRASAQAAHTITSSCLLASETNTLRGSLDGANYTIQVPANWNGTLILYSHGYT